MGQDFNLQHSKTEEAKKDIANYIQNMVKVNFYRVLYRKDLEKIADDIWEIVNRHA